jgi:DNA-binding MarR family transcriptional regulator
MSSPQRRSPTGRAPTGKAPTGKAQDEAFSNLEQQLAILLRRARAYSEEVARDLHPELQGAAYALLARLQECGATRASELSSYFGVDKAAVSRQLRLLEDLGFVRRDSDPSDGRAQQLALTALGRRRLTRAQDARRRRMREQLQSWRRADVLTLGELLTRFNESQRITLEGEPEDAVPPVRRSRATAGRRA